MKHCVVDLAQSSNAGNGCVGVAGGIIRSGAAPGGGSRPSSGDAWLLFAVDGGAQAPLGSRGGPSFRSRRGGWEKGLERATVDSTRVAKLLYYHFGHLRPAGQRRTCGMNDLETYISCLGSKF